ncbi:hypothetical protein TNCV_4220771 [Trichonephila clavipes]|nr:hypothetical protein TNCV_4220771 [Trichonephila clavipes]
MCDKCNAGPNFEVSCDAGSDEPVSKYDIDTRRFRSEKCRLTLNGLPIYVRGLNDGGTRTKSSDTSEKGRIHFVMFVLVNPEVCHSFVLKTVNSVRKWKDHLDSTGSHLPNLSEEKETKLLVQLINTTNERRLVKGHETTPLRVKGDIEDIYGEPDNGG